MVRDRGLTSKLVQSTLKDSLDTGIPGQLETSRSGIRTETDPAGYDPAGLGDLAGLHDEDGERQGASGSGRRVARRAAKSRSAPPASASASAGPAEEPNSDSDAPVEEYAFEQKAHAQAMELLRLVPGEPEEAEEALSAPPLAGVAEQQVASSSSAPSAPPAASAAQAPPASSESRWLSMARTVPGKRYKQVYRPSQDGGEERLIGELQPVGTRCYQLAAKCFEHTGPGVKCSRMRAWRMSKECIDQVEISVIQWLARGEGLTAAQHSALPKD